MDKWYRLINPKLIDPAGLHTKGGPGAAVKNTLSAIITAEKFHQWLADYYHPTTFAYYGNDKMHAAYGQIRWVAHEPPANTNTPMTAANIKNAKSLVHEPDGARTVEVEGKFVLTFAVEPQESSGDDTVSHHSGEGPVGKIKQLFATRGYRHQESYKNRDSILLTHYCIVKIVQEMEKNGQEK